MSVSERRFPKLQQSGVYVLAILTSIVLTVATLRIFPNLLIPVYAPKSPEIQTQQSIQPSTQSIPVSPVAKAEAFDRNFVVAAVNRVSAVVVRVDTERTIARNIADPFFDDPFFRQFFGEEFLPKLPRQYHQHGQGSGFIIDRDGIVLTNAHVVKGADTVTVSLNDGRVLQGKVRGIDELLDLGVIKIDGQNLPVATLGNSSDVRVGDWAIAVGNPFGLDRTVTLGIISTLHRSSAQAGIPDKQLEFIQTDAAINPGNSGGPLLNAKGDVIGINTAIRSDAQGIGFAIPIDTAKAIKDRLIRGEKIPHPYIGIRMVTLTPEVAEEFNKNNPNASSSIPKIKGVLVIQVMPNSPAASAQLQPGDAIVEIDNQPVTTADQFQDKVAKSRIGQSLQLKVYRGQQTLQLTVRPAEFQDAVRS
jgi:S1-C subfamily serine protease